VSDWLRRFPVDSTIVKKEMPQRKRWKDADVLHISAIIERFLRKGARLKLIRVVRDIVNHNREIMIHMLKWMARSIAGFLVRKILMWLIKKLTAVFEFVIYAFEHLAEWLGDVLASPSRKRA
jgi:hypothetical protein